MTDDWIALTGIDRTHRVCLVTVTYGSRAKLCCESVRRALDAGVQEVVVVDNGSTVESANQLIQFVAQYPNTTLVRLESNMGSASGFSAGLQSFLDGSATHVWLLDDDNRVRDDCLEMLLAAFEIEARRQPGRAVAVAAFRESNALQGRVARGGNPRRVYPPRGSFLSVDLLHLLFRGIDSFWFRHTEVAALPRLPYAPYGGLLASRDTISTVGLPDERFVLYEDDTEWTSRFKRVGIEIVLCASARITDADKKWGAHAGGFPLSRAVRSGNLIRTFFSTRNRVYFDHRRAASPLEKIRYAVNRTLVVFLVLATSSLSHHREARRNFLHAVADGQGGDFSRAFMPKNL